MDKFVEVELNETKKKTPKINSKMAANAIKSKPRKKLTPIITTTPPKQKSQIKTSASNKKKRNKARASRAPEVSNLPKIASAKAKEIATKTIAVNQLIQIVKKQLNLTCFGSMVDNDPNTDISIHLANIQVQAILGSKSSKGGSNVTFDQPISVATNRYVDLVTK